MYIKMESTKLNTAKLSELKKLMPHGAIGEIAQELGIHRNNVADVFKGKWENQQVIDLAIQKIEHKRLHIKSIESKIDKVLNQG